MWDVLAAAGGVLHRRDLLQHAPRQVIERAARSGRLLHLFPQVYALSTMAEEPMLRLRAALCYGGIDSVLSGTTALALHGLPDLINVADPIHVDSARSKGAAGLVIHRRSRESHSIMRAGVPVTHLERSLVDGWDWLKRQEDPLCRALVIEAVGRRLTTPARLLAAITGNVAARQDLLRLTNLLDAGCRSELELWGYENVFRGPDLPRFERAVPVDLGGRTIYLDLLDRQTLTNVELDGRPWHTLPADRERDLRRDAALATLGYLVIRVSGARLHGEPEIVRAEVKSILATRREMIRWIAH